MKTLSLLIGLRLREMFSSLLRGPSRGGKRRSPVVMVLLALLLVYVAAVFMFLFFSVFLVMWIALEGAGLELSFFFGIAGLLTVALCVFGSVLATQSALYQARDNEQLLSMPLSPTLIMLSRMIFLLLINTAFAAVVAVPAFVVYLMLGRPGLLSALGFILFFILLSVLALAISCLLGWLVALVTARMKHKNVFSLIFMVLFLILYFVGMGALGAGLESMEMNIQPLVEAISPYLAVFLWVGRALLYGDVLAALLFLLVFAVVVGCAFLFLSRTYLRILTTNRGSAQYTYRERASKQRSATGALVKKEISHFVGNATYMLNEGLGLLFAVGISIYFLVQRDVVLSVLHSMGLASASSVLVAGVLSLCASMVIISAPSVSLEGKNVWIAQSLPLSGGQVLCAKAYAHILIASPFFLLASVLSAIACGAGVLDALGILLLPLSCNAFCAFFGVTMNILFPKLDWLNEAYAVKSGAAVMLTMFGMMLICGLQVVLLLVLAILGLPALVVMLLPSALFLGLSAALRAYLNGAGARRFSSL